ncbi:hypothetical protein HDV00_008246 [Rhizophlyctis rosea]|nr:hypothetical protein HDV00_008246 [Rhizophlyctis rosea]
MTVKGKGREIINNRFPALLPLLHQYNGIDLDKIAASLSTDLAPAPPPSDLSPNALSDPLPNPSPIQESSPQQSAPVVVLEAAETSATLPKSPAAPPLPTMSRRAQKVAKNWKRVVALLKCQLGCQTIDSETLLLVLVAGMQGAGNDEVAKLYEMMLPGALVVDQEDWTRPARGVIPDDMERVPPKKHHRYNWPQRCKNAAEYTQTAVEFAIANGQKQIIAICDFLDASAMQPYVLLAERFDYNLVRNLPWPLVNMLRTKIPAKFPTEMVKLSRKQKHQYVIRRQLQLFFWRMFQPNPTKQQIFEAPKFADVVDEAYRLYRREIEKTPTGLGKIVNGEEKIVEGFVGMHPAHPNCADTEVIPYFGVLQVLHAPEKERTEQLTGTQLDEVQPDEVQQGDVHMGDGEGWRKEEEREEQMERTREKKKWKRDQYKVEQQQQAGEEREEQRTERTGQKKKQKKKRAQDSVEQQSKGKEGEEQTYRYDEEEEEEGSG